MGNQESLTGDRIDIGLGVNIDHVATLRQARGTRYPDPLQAAFVVQDAGANGITVHLREDRRHIRDDDVQRLSASLLIPMNLEMAATSEMLAIASRIKPEECCLVPERREELTTEGGLNAADKIPLLRDYSASLTATGTRVSLFIDPEPRQVEAAAEIGAPIIELHTGAYADSTSRGQRRDELQRLQEAAMLAHTLGLQVNAGHGLNYVNVDDVAAVSQIKILNIGHAIVARAVIHGLSRAVMDMKQLMQQARRENRKGF